MNFIYKLILFILLIQFNAYEARADQGHVANEWLKLMHYEKKMTEVLKA